MQADEGAIELSAEDAADIAAAYGLLDWDDPVGYSLEQASTALTDLQQKIERCAGTEAAVPWNADDDWDTPADGRGSGASIRRGTPTRIVCGQSAAGARLGART